MGFTIVMGGCNSGPPWDGRGIVSKRTYQAAHTEVEWNCYSRDKDGNCTLNVPSDIYYPDKWYLTAVTHDTDSKGKVHTRTHTLRVTEAEFNACKVGDRLADRRCGG